MKWISRFGWLAAALMVVSMASPVQAGWRKKVIIVQPTTIVTPVTPQTTQWVTSNGAVIESKYNMIAAEPLGTSAPPLPVVGGYVTTGYVATGQKVKVVTPRRVTRYYAY